MIWGVSATVGTVFDETIAGLEFEVNDDR